VGITHNIEDRLKYHNGKRVRSTRNKAPWIVIYTESYGAIQDARNREKFLKSYEGVKEKREIISKNCK
jgi:putative endonuclease